MTRDKPFDCGSPKYPIVHIIIANEKPIAQGISAETRGGRDATERAGEGIRAF